MRLLHGQSAPGVVAVDSRPQPREGTLASVHCLPWAWLSHALPCLSPWQPNSALPTLYHINLRLHPLLKGTQLGLLWGGGASSACPVSPPLPGLGAKVSPPLPHYRNIPDTSAWTALGMTWTSRALGAHLALPLGFSCRYSGPWLAWAVLMIPSGSQS